MKSRSTHRAIILVFAAQLISVAGDRLFTLALSWWVVSHETLEHREWTLGMLLAVSTLPAALSGPIIGPIVDRLNRKTCMILADSGRLLVMVALAVLANHEALSVPILFGLCVPLFALEPLFDSAVSASLSSIAKTPLMLERLVALESALPNTGAVLGAMLASLVLAVWNTSGGFWFNAMTFLMSLTLVSMLPPLKPAPKNTADGSESSSYGFLRSYPDEMRLVLLFCAINFFEAPVFLYLPLITRDILQADGATLSFLELAFAAGNLGVYGYFSVLPRRFMRTRWLRFILVATSAVCFGLLGALETVASLCFVLLLGGACVGFVTFLAISSFQRSIGESCKGRFFAILTSLSAISLPISFAISGALSANFPLQELIRTNAMCALLVALAFLTVPDDHAPNDSV